MIRKSLKRPSLIKYKNPNEREKHKNIAINKKNILSLYNLTNKLHIEENILKEIIKCHDLKVIDTYYKNNTKVSIVELESVQLDGLKNFVNIEETNKGLSIKKRELYKVNNMLSIYKNEEIVGSVKYLNYKQRKKHKVETIDGRFYQNGKLYNAYNAIYVMSKSGVIYCYNDYVEGMFQHSSFLAGQPVACAGKIDIEKGYLKSVNNDSGHYAPDKEKLDQLTSELKARGVDLSRVEIKFYEEILCC